MSIPLLKPQQSKLHLRLGLGFIEEWWFDLPETVLQFFFLCLPICVWPSCHLTTCLHGWVADQRVSDLPITQMRRGKMSQVRSRLLLLVFFYFSSQPLTGVIDANEKLGQSRFSFFFGVGWGGVVSCQESWQESGMRQQRWEAKPIAGTWLIR